MSVKLGKITLLLLIATSLHGTENVRSSSTKLSFDSLLRTTNGTGNLSLDQKYIETLIKNAEDIDPAELAQTQFDRLHMLERNLVKGGYHLEKGTASYNAMLYSLADDNALALSKDAYKNYRASLYLAGKQCAIFFSPTSCVETMKPAVKPTKSLRCTSSVYRSINGSCNNENNPLWGSAYSPYTRLFSSQYTDGVWDMHAKDLPNAVAVGIKFEDKIINHETRYSMGFVGWTNLVAFDLAHTVSHRMLHFGDNIVCCRNDLNISPRYKHPFCSPLLVSGSFKCNNYVRSMLSTPNDKLYGPAQQMNAATHYLDASSIYGTTDLIARMSRLKKRGQLKIFLSNCQERHKCLNLADSRPNMDPVSATTHTILMFEHNRIAKQLHALNPGWPDETLYQEARRIVIAQIQHITYNEWLPILIGEKLNSINYDPMIASGVYNSFGNVAMQFVLSLFPNELSLYDEDLTITSKIPMRFTMVDHSLLKNKSKFDSLVRMLANQPMSALDLNFTDAITKKMFSEDDVEGFNGVSLTVQRSRDHGIPAYIEFKHMLMNSPIDEFSHLKFEIPTKTLELLENIYKKTEYIDLFIGGLAEMPKNGALIGPTLLQIIKNQMILTKIGDQFFYDNPSQKYPFTADQLKEIKKSSFARLLCDNSKNIKQMQPKAFETEHLQNKLVNCSDETEIPTLNLGYWKK